MPHVTTPETIDAGLLLFAVQHTVMARPWFKRRCTRLVPAPAERATLVVAASLALALLFWLWRPVHGTVWQLSGAAGAAGWAVYVAGLLPAHCRRLGPARGGESSRGSATMSVLIIAKFQGDTATFRRALTERAGEFEKNRWHGPRGGRHSSPVRGW
jgi:hypothetical protein